VLGGRLRGLGNTNVHYKTPYICSAVFVHISICKKPRQYMHKNRTVANVRLEMALVLPHWVSCFLCLITLYASLLLFIWRFVWGAVREST
jgi:hypothetical protein